jgi:hypothetical protein
MTINRLEITGLEFHTGCAILWHFGLGTAENGAIDRVPAPAQVYAGSSGFGLPSSPANGWLGRPGTQPTLAHPPYGHPLDGTYPHAAEKQKAKPRLNCRSSGNCCSPPISLAIYIDRVTFASTLARDRAE